LFVLLTTLATHSTDESTAGCILRPHNFSALPSYSEFIMYHGTKIQAVPSHAALCSHHDPWLLSYEKGWSVKTMVSGAVAAEGSEGDYNPHLLLVAQALFSVMILLTLAKVCISS
jgi:hypothetical protein